MKSLVLHCIHTQPKETQGLKLLKHRSLPSICKDTTITRNEWGNQNGTKVCTAAEEDFHDLFYAAVTQAAPCNMSVKKISVVLLCSGQRCFLSILRSLQDSPFMLSTPPESFQQTMKPIRDKCQHTNLLNSKQKQHLGKVLPFIFYQHCNSR